MATSRKFTPVKPKPANYFQWIDLNDPNRAKLQMGVYKDQLILVIAGVTPRSNTYYRVINELGFVPSKNGAYLAKSVGSTKEKVTPAMFRGIWPQAQLKLMDLGGIRLDFEKIAQKAREERERRAAQGEDVASAAADSLPETVESVTEILNRSAYLGRNRHGAKVFSDASDRFLLDQSSDDDRIEHETPESTKPDFLRGTTQSEVRECCLGLLRACEHGESQNLEALTGFAATVLQKAPETLTAQDRDLIAQTIDSAILESLVENNPTAGNAWADATYYQEMMPGRAALSMVDGADSAQAPYLPAPVAVQIQRFLSGANLVSIHGKVPGYGFGLLAEGTRVFVEDADTQEWGNAPTHRPLVEPLRDLDAPVEAAYVRLDGMAGASDLPARLRAVFDNLAENAVGVITSNDLDMNQAAPLFAAVNAQLVQAVKVPHWMTNTAKPTLLYVVKRGDAVSDAEDQDDDFGVDAVPGASARAPSLAQVAGWNDLKALVDETLLRLGKDAAANEVIRDVSSRTENRYQRPYIAFSKIGPSSTMVPKNLQSALSFALARIEEAHGPIDTFVADELGIGQESLADRFSPEQVDAVGLTVNRLQSGRGFILGDETGIGKGRTLAAVSTWANKLDKPIIFITDRANLFSDLARDLIDIGEWERFRPLITNADGQILNIMGDAEPLAEPLTAAEMRRVMQMDPKDVNANLIFTTYSQIHSDDSAKGRWLREMARNALVIADEAHIAAGSDSNTAKIIQEMVDSAWGVVYSSATWAKSSKSLHIYSRALPESVNINQVISAMRKDGEGFSEIFSSMLAMDGAFVRREHDLSKIDFVVEVDTENAERNTQVAGQVSEILGMMAMLSGEITHQLQRLNAQTRTALMTAQAARQSIVQRTGEAAARAEHDQTEQERLSTAVVDIQAARVHVQAALDRLLAEQPEDPLALGDAGNVLPYEALLADPEGELARLDPEEVRRHDTGEQHSHRMAVIRHKIQLNNLETRLAQTQQAYELAVQAVAADAENPVEAVQAGKLFASNFGTGGAIYQTMRRVLAALSVDHTADKAIRAAQAGRRPVIVFEETGETFVRQFLEDEVERIKTEIAEMRAREAAGEVLQADADTREIADLLDAGTKMADLVKRVRMPTIQDMMRNLLARLGGVKVLETDNPQADTEDDAAPAARSGAPAATFVAQSHLADVPGIEAEVVEKYLAGVRAIAEKINQLPPLPIMPVDALRLKMERAGLKMGEISGRNYALQVDPAAVEHLGKRDVHATLIKRARKKIDVTHDVKAFNAAQMDAIAINKSAATGLSLHASPRFPDSRQRELFEMQTDENPTNRIQLFGRINRFDQVIPPKISMMTTGLRGEMRTIMMQNKKLTNLSANIRSSRENAALIEDVPDLLNRTGDRVCQEYLLENPGVAGRLDIPMSRINMPSGLSHMVTQRIALLSPKDQDKVYEDLIIAYNDALLENQLAQESDSIITRDWRAKTTRQRVAWGPTEHLELLSAFDSPVIQREVTFTQNYQPLYWPEVRDLIAQSSQALARDARVKPMHVVSIDEHDGDAHLLLSADLEREEALDGGVLNDMWVGGLLESLTAFLPDEALAPTGTRPNPAPTPGDPDQTVPAAEGQDTDAQDDELDVDGDADDAGAEGLEDGLSAGLEVLALNPSAVRRRGKRAPLGFASIAKRWVAVQSRIPGTRLTQRMMGLVSPSGKTAKFWFLDEQGQARQFLMNLDAAVARYGQPGVGEVMKELLPLAGLTEDSWQRQRFNQVWGSFDPEVKLLDLSDAVNKAIQVMEAKKLIALPQTGFDTVEAALLHPEHNAVKEVTFRQAFMEKVIGRLTPGADLWLKPKETGNRHTSAFFRKSQIVTRVDLPEPGYESVLSRWKFHLVGAGEEAPTVVSGALLFKLSAIGNSDNFDRLSIYDNLYTGMGRGLPLCEDSFNRFEKGEVTRKRTLLVGNMFQASEWARDSKEGIPILYSDETGQRHRAVEVKNSGWMRQSITFPLRLHARDMIKDFFRFAHGDTPVLPAGAPAPTAPELADDAHDAPPGPLPGLRQPTIVYTSFRGALSSGKDRGDIDAMIIDVANNAIGWQVDKAEKDKVRRALRSAVNADKKLWVAEHPDAPYPVEFTTHLPRASKNKQVQFSVKLPATQEGRDRFLDIFVRTLGLQLFVPKRNRYGNDNPAFRLARQAERAFYDRLAQPGEAARAQAEAVRARRNATREMMQAAFQGEGRRVGQDQIAAPAQDTTQTVSQDSQAEPQDPLIGIALEELRHHNLARILTSQYITFNVEGDEVLFTDEMRAQVETILGEPLVEAVLPGLEGQITLVPRSAAPGSAVREIVAPNRTLAARQ